MENKYFTPNIEDIRVGYECECLWCCPNPRVWIPIEVTEDDREEYAKLPVQEVIHRIKEIRVPYLTKEQIEAEGWVYKGTAGTPGASGIRKGDELSEKQKLELKHKIFCGHNEYSILKNDTWYRLWHYCEESRKIRIIREDDETLFLGRCEDVNTLRHICKMVGI